MPVTDLPGSWLTSSETVMSELVLPRSAIAPVSSHWPLAPLTIVGVIALAIEGRTANSNSAMNAANVKRSPLDSGARLVKF